MKTAIYLFSATLMGLSACSSAYHASNFEDDDIYFTSKDAFAEEMATNEASQNELDFIENQKNTNSGSYQNQDKYNDNPPENDYYDDNAQQRQSTTSNSDGGVTNNYYYGNNYDYDDYYDYAYSARIRRFHQPIVSYSYYDTYYTNNYWYSYNSFNYGNSIYYGYQWWNPSPWTFTYSWSPYNAGYASWGPSWGYGGCGYYNSSYYNPYFNNYGWNSYNAGYWNGFYDGAYGYSAANYYYNSYDNNSTYYGHRNVRTTSSDGRSAFKKSFSETYNEAVANDNKGNTGGRSTQNNKSNVPVATEKDNTGRTVVGNKSTPTGTKNQTDEPRPGKNNGLIQEGGNTKYNEPKNDGAIKSRPTDTYRPLNENKPYSTPGNKDTYSRPKGNNDQGKDVYHERPNNHQQNDTRPNKSTYDNRNNQPKENSRPSYNQPKNTYSEPRENGHQQPKGNNTNSQPKGNNNNYSPPKQNHNSPRTYSSPKNNSSEGGRQYSSPSYSNPSGGKSAPAGRNPR